MEKKYVNLFFLVVIVVSSSLAIPISGITAEEYNIKNVQYYCC